MFKIGDTVQIKKEWWPQTSPDFKAKFGSIQRKGTIIKMCSSNYILVKWDKIGQCGGNWTSATLDLYKEKEFNHPNTNIFK